MPNQAIIKNIIEGNAIAVKQAIYESLSEKAFDLLEIKKVEIGSDIFDQQNESVDELEEGTVHPADAHRILNQTGGVDESVEELDENFTHAVYVAYEHPVLGQRGKILSRHKNHSSAESTKKRKFPGALGTFVGIKEIQSKYKPNNESVEDLDESKLYPIKHIDDYGNPTNKTDKRYTVTKEYTGFEYRDWETDRKSTRLNSSHSRASRMPSSA